MSEKEQKVEIKEEVVETKEESKKARKEQFSFHKIAKKILESVADNSKLDLSTFPDKCLKTAKTTKAEKTMAGMVDRLLKRGLTKEDVEADFPEAYKAWEKVNNIKSDKLSASLNGRGLIYVLLQSLKEVDSDIYTWAMDEIEK